MTKETAKSGIENFYSKVSEIQVGLKAPKSQRNTFGNYNYRNQEDILEAVKPLLKTAGLVLTVNDEVIEIGGRIYIKATATITDGVNTLENSASAREPETKKGMDEAQITGATSSYARKYALNGLFLIDDTKDADSMDNGGKEDKASPVGRKSAVKNVSKSEVPKTDVGNEQAETVKEETVVEGTPAVRGGSFRRRARGQGAA